MKGAGKQIGSICLAVSANPEHLCASLFRPSLLVGLDILSPVKTGTNLNTFVDTIVYQPDVAHSICLLTMLTTDDDDDELASTRAPSRCRQTRISGPRRHRSTPAPRMNQEGAAAYQQPWRRCQFGALQRRAAGRERAIRLLGWIE